MDGGAVGADFNAKYFRIGWPSLVTQFHINDFRNLLLMSPGIGAFFRRSTAAIRIAKCVNCMLF